jgi:hypothetical protein
MELEQDMDPCDLEMDFGWVDIMMEAKACEVIFIELTYSF